MKNSIAILLSIATGILLAFPWIFPGQSWTLFVAFVPLLFADEFAVQEKIPKKVSVLFYPGLLSFLVWNLLSTWWIGYVSVLGMLLIAVINSLIMAAVWWLRHPLAKRLGKISSHFSLLVFWLTFEFFQHIWALQWPWLTLGNGLANSVKIIQWFEYTGVLGGTLWILLTNILIYTAAKNIAQRDFGEFVRSTGMTLAVLVLPIVFSVNRYSGYTEKGTEFNILVLQPNLDPYTQKFSGIGSEEQVQNLISMVKESDLKSTQLILAPETALPDVWEDSVFYNHSGYNSIFDFLKRNPDVSILSGAITKRKYNSVEEMSETIRVSAEDSTFYDVFNSALLFENPDEVKYYHKSILVSGVEKMPFQKYLFFLRNYLLQLGGAGGSLTEGKPSVMILNRDSVKIGTIICFESAFGKHVGEIIKKGANLLVVITNDGWWKESAGVWQHFGYSRIRAIETRRDIARSSNTGISGFINQKGDVEVKTEMNQRTCIKSIVRLNDEVTFYTSYGDYIGKISMILSLLVAIFYFYRR